MEALAAGAVSVPRHDAIVTVSAFESTLQRHLR